MLKNNEARPKIFLPQKQRFPKRTVLTVMVLTGLYLGNAAAYAAAASSPPKTAEENDIAYSYVLQDVLVWGNRWDSISVGQTSEDLPGGYISQGARLGFLGETSILKTPFTQFSFTEKAIQDYGDPSQPINSVAVNMPSVKTSGCTMYNDFSIRGQNLNGYQMYLNGIPDMFKQANTPINFTERLEVASGPNKGITGTAANESAGGLVNIVSKRANGNYAKVTTIFSGHSSFGQLIDVSRRFGKNNEWGLRINAQNVNGETAIEDERLTNRDITLNFDHKTANSYTNLFMGYFYSKQKNGQRWFGFRGPDFKAASAVLRAPDAAKNLSFHGQVFEYDDWAITLNHEQKFTKNWKVFLNAGYNRYDLFNNVNSKSSKYFVINKNGDFQALNWVQNFPITSYYGQIGVQGVEHTGSVKHTLVAAIDKSWYNTYRNLDSTDQANQLFSTPNGNLYSGVPFGPYTNYHADKVRWGSLGSTSRKWSWSLNDNIEYKKLNILLGYFYNHSRTNTYNKTGAITKAAHSQAGSPTYGIVYSPTDQLSFYASHSESFNMETVVSNKYKNVGEILPAAKTKQNEIGVKYLNRDLLTSLSLFDIKKAGNIEVTEGANLYQRQAGEDEYKGVEVAFNGKLAPKWNLMGGMMYLDAKHHKTTKPILENQRISGASRWNGILALEYEADDRYTLFGRILYNGAAIIWDADITNQLDVSPYTTLDVGVKYKTTWNKIPVQFNLTCYNVLGKDYWIPKSGVDTVILGNPRTLTLSAQFTF